jgi:hypothetical protein
LAETALNPRDPAGDYAAKRKALQDLGMNKDVDQAVVLQRRLDLDREAKAKGVAEEYTPAPAKPPRTPRGFNKQGTGLGNKLAQLNRKEWEEKKKKEQGVTEDTGSWIVYDPETRQIKKRFKTHTAGKSYAKTHGLGFASSEFYFDRVKDNKEVAEGAMSNLHAELSDVYNRMAPGIERNRDSFKAGQLYDALEAVAEQHGAEAEFKRMMNGARNCAHMDYDTNPGGFHNWFWYLPFEGETNEGLMKEPANRKEYLDQRDKLFRMMSMETNPANKQIIKQAIKDLEARYGATNKPVTEESSTSSEAVEIALIRRVLVAHTDLIMQFGLDKVTQAIEEVAYNVGDVDEIGSSDVSGWIHQVKQILGVPEALDEKWSQKYKSSINCANPKGFSQKAHCAGKKK